LFFIFYACVHHLDCNSFPTRRSSDLFIEALPHAHDEKVSEKGADFSSGQRQLLAFSRTMAKTPKILILDEATANIDSTTESVIQDRKSTRLNSSHVSISYAVFCLKKK